MMLSQRMFPTRGVSEMHCINALPALQDPDEPSVGEVVPAAGSGPLPGTAQQGLLGDELHPTGRSPSATFRGNRRLAAQASEAASVDIFEDVPVLHYMATGELFEQLSHPSARRIVRRAKGYKLITHPAGSIEVHHLMSNGSFREVPAPARRADKISAAHTLSGHFGVRRTAHLLLLRYWWQGIMRDVSTIISQC